MTNTSSTLRYFLLFSLVLCSSISFAQLHLKVGYTPSYYQPEENNKLLEAYNARNSWLDSKFEKVNWSHGLDVGLRYRIGFVALEANWRVSFTDTKAEGKLPGTNTDFQKKLLYRFNKYSIGMENYIGPIGLGASIGFNRMTMRERTEDDRFDLLSTNQYTGTLFLGLYTKHDNAISFGLRPFVQLPLSQFDISKLAINLEEPAAGELSEKEYMVFGISLVIFNGY